MTLRIILFTLKSFIPYLFNVRFFTSDAVCFLILLNIFLKGLMILCFDWVIISAPFIYI